MRTKETNVQFENPKRKLFKCDSKLKPTKSDSFFLRMGSVIGKNASLIPTQSRQTSFSDEASNVRDYSLETKQKDEIGDDYATCMNQWTDEVTYKYLDIALRADLENNPLPAVGDFDPPTAYMADIKLEESVDEDPRHDSPLRSDFLNFPPTALESISTNDESEEEDKPHLELENKILQDQAKVSRSLLSECPATHKSSGISEIQFVLNFDASVPNPEETASTRLPINTSNELPVLPAIEKNLSSAIS